jgi:hypothetical protein
MISCSLQLAGKHKRHPSFRQIKKLSIIHKQNYVHRNYGKVLDYMKRKNNQKLTNKDRKKFQPSGNCEKLKGVTF